MGLFFYIVEVNLNRCYKILHVLLQVCLLHRFWDPTDFNVVTVGSVLFWSSLSHLTCHYGSVLNMVDSPAHMILFIALKRSYLCVESSLRTSGCIFKLCLAQAE